MSEDQNQQPQTQGESKVGIGFVCAFFLGLIGLIIGVCCFKSGTYERKTFMKGFWWTFIITAIIYVVIIVLYFTVFAGMLGSMLGGLM